MTLGDPNAGALDRGPGEIASPTTDAAPLLLRAVELAVELTTIVAELEVRGGAEAKQARNLIAALLARPRRGAS